MLAACAIRARINSSGSYIGGCYSAAVTKRHTILPRIWLISDARNDAGLEAAIARLPRGSGFIYRHYHLAGPQRRARFDALRRVARSAGHLVVLAGSAAVARRWKADGAYGDSQRLAHGPALLRLATAHSLRDLGRVRRADAVLLSPVYATRSHPDAPVLGAVRTNLLAVRSVVPVLALGGLVARRAKPLRVHGWAGIDGPAKRRRSAA